MNKTAKSILLSNSFEKLASVYSAEVLEKLESTAELDTTFRNKAMILADKASVADTEYIFSTWGMPVFDEAEIAACFPKLKAVFYAAGSVQEFAKPFLNAHIKVFSAWAANAVPVAEYTAAQIVLGMKGFFAASRLCKHSYKEAKACFAAYPGVYDETVGIIGAGMIGKMVIEKLKDLHLNVLVFDPFLPDERAEKLGVVRCSLEEVFEKSDVITNHLANNAQTVGMLNYRLFSRMKPYATFINTGRGEQVVEEDLCRAMSEVPTRAAVLDVTVSEPPEPGAEFYRLKNVYLTPHIAGSLGNEVHRMAEYMFDEFTRVSRGEKAKYSVTAEMLKTMA